MSKSSVVALVLLIVIDVSNALPPPTCNYVYTAPTTEGRAYAVDVCREIVTNGYSQWRKYVCNGTTIYDETYQGADCSGNVMNSTVVNDTTSECSVVDSTGCIYAYVKEPCNNQNDYSVEPYIIGECIPISGSSSFQYECDDTTPKMKLYVASGTCTSVSTQRDISTCNSGVGVAVEGKFCKTKVYGPTSMPTAEPSTNPTKMTSMPTINPTMDPTMIPTNNPTTVPTTDNPTKFPTELPTTVPTTNPSTDPTTEPTFVPTLYPTTEPTFEPTASTAAPSKVPTAITASPTNQPSYTPTTYSPTTSSPTYSPITKAPTTATPTTAIPTAYLDESKTSRLHRIGNIIFVTFMVTFMSLTL